MAPRRDPLGTVEAAAVDILPAGIVGAATTDPALENADNQDLGSASAVTEPTSRRIATAITGRLLLDVICMFTSLLSVVCYLCWDDHMQMTKRERQ
jgi:hypothetical protein